ncbi:MAG: DUF2779 domain-containing protein [Gemmatimonadales bacterium]
MTATPFHYTGVPAAEGSPGLTKSRFMAGWQCHKLLWWTAHEPEAEELIPDIGTQDLFDQSREVEREAHKLFPGGEFEARFEADGVQVRVDVLLRAPDGCTLIEVKSSSGLKDEHIPDAAVQVHVLRKAGVDVRRVEIMYLNKAYRYPVGDLFVRDDVTAKVEALLPEVPRLITEQLTAIRGPRPEVAIGRHCSDPRECPFWDRCWPKDRFHVTKLYRGGEKGLNLMRRGIALMSEIPPGEKLSDTQKRQKLSAERGALVVQPTLAAALRPFEGRLGYLDFETIRRAVPVWPGTKPWQQTVVQFSYHEDLPGGGQSHVGWLAEGPTDPRDELARVMLEATQHAEKIVMYSSFERSRIRDLQEALPRRRAELEALEAKLIDLLPVMQGHVYHPDFNGSFSLKYTLTPLVPELTYNDLMIQEGMRASVEIWRLLFVAHLIRPERRAALRKDLLAYCERDTLAMVKLLSALRKLASPSR